jgi:hypothetical protein
MFITGEQVRILKGAVLTFGWTDEGKPLRSSVTIAISPAKIQTGYAKLTILQEYVITLADLD